MSGPTNELTGSAATLIAIAGGSGAFLGAVVGQAIQWWRDAVKTKIEDRRRMEDRVDAFNREQRESKRNVYDQVAFELEEIITALDWYSFSEYSNDRPVRNRTPEQLSQLHTRRWGDLWGVLSERQETIRRQLITVGSSEMQQLRSLMYIVYDVLQEFSPSWVYDQSEDRPIRYLSKFEFAEDGTVSKFWGPVSAGELAAEWEENFRITRRVCVWGLKQIVAEMSNTPNPDPLPFRAPDLEVTRIL